jgi:hypothetical protein
MTFANQVSAGHDDAIAFGVLPHVANDMLMLSNLRMIVGGKGKVFVEFRNKLFSLFSMNRHTYEFVIDDLLAPVDPQLREATAAELRARLAMDVPPRPKADAGISYEGIRAKFHNPFELQDVFDRAGFRNIRLHWYHYHPGLPFLEQATGALWREEAFKLEHETSGWRGYFLCSSGVIEADA